MFNYILQGQVKKYVNRLKNTNMFNLEDWLKTVLNLFNIPYYDDCCPTNNLPVRYSSNDTLEKYNGSQWEEIDVCALCPTPSSNKNYGSFYDTTNQTGNSNTILTLELSNSDSWNQGVYLDNNKTQIVIENPGVYNIAFSAQMVKETGNSDTYVHLWLSQNGHPVPYSNSQVSFPSNSVYIVSAWNFFFETTTANEYVELQWHISSNQDNAVVIESMSPGIKPGHPETPGLIVTVNQVD